jgi:DNA-binding response OmpR family regulator
MTQQPIVSEPVPPPPIVLLVEDDADTREMYHTALEFSGFWVVDAPDVANAKVSVLEVQPDVIVADLGLPGNRDGIGLARDLRQDPRTAEIPVLAVTGRDPGSLGEAAQLFREVLVKPLLPDVLVERIRKTLLEARHLRARSLAARSRVSQLLDNSERILAKSQHMFGRRARGLGRACPKCDAPLVWSERRKVFGVTTIISRVRTAAGCTATTTASRPSSR